MDLLNTMFILTFILIYSTLSLVLLGNWAYERVRVFKEARRQSAPRRGKLGA